MKKKWLLTLLVSVVLLGNIDMIANLNNQTVEAKAYHRSYTTKHSIIYKNNIANLRITKAQGFLAKNGNYAPEHQILLYGTLYNKSSHGVIPEDFWDDHFRAFQVTHNSWHQLGMYGGASIYDSTEYIESLEDKASDTVRPHRLLSFILVCEDGLKFWQGQRIAVRTYKNANFIGFKPLATKKFSLEVYGYRAKQLQKAKKIRQKQKLAIQKKKERKKRSNFYKIANQYDVYCPNNSNAAYIKNIGYFYPTLLVHWYDGQISLGMSFHNNSNQSIIVNDLLNNYFDIFNGNIKLNFKVDDIEKANIARPHKETTVSLMSTNNIGNPNQIKFVVKNNYSTNKRNQYFSFEN